MTESSVGTWEEAHRLHEWGLYYDPRLMVLVWKRYGLRKDAGTVRILDIGCGVGVQTFELKRLGYDAAGIDFAPSAISRAKEIAAKFGVEVPFYVADILALPQRVGIVDCVTDVACLECLDEAQFHTALRNITTILRDDGTLFSLTKAFPWVQKHNRVGRGSRTMSSDEVKSFYFHHFRTVEFFRDEHVDGSGELIPEWIVSCSNPRK